MESYLRMVVISELARSPMSGYALMRKIEKGTGCYRPSAGSIYPLLSHLKKEGIVDYRQQSKQKVYFLTAKGRKSSQMLQKRRKAIINSLAAKLSMFEAMPREESQMMFAELLKKARERRFPRKLLGSLGPEVLQMREQILRLYIEGKTETKKIQIRKILADANRKLEMI